MFTVSDLPELTDETLEIFKNLKSVLAGEFEGDENSVFDALFASPDKETIAKAIPELAALLAFGVEEAAAISTQVMRNAVGDVVTSAQKISIIKALEQAGLGKEEISEFFKDRTEFTAGSIKEYLDGIEDAFTNAEKEKEFKNLATDLFDVLTGKQESQGFMNSIERAKNQVDTILELQEKLKNEGLSAEEFATAKDILGGSEFLDDFFAGTLSADYNQESFDGIKEDLQQALNAALAELEFDQNNQLLQNEVASLRFLLNNIDDMFKSKEIDNYYQSQIDYIEKLNSKLQQQVNLEQQKIDMNRSMLSLNRKIRALERDTSYGAQASLGELEMTREKEAMNRQAFLMEMVANQQIEQIESQMAQARDEAVLDINETVNNIYDFFKNQAGVNPFTIYTGNTSG